MPERDPVEGEAGDVSATVAAAPTLDVLVVLEDDFPWGETAGGPLRSRQVIGALAQIGRLDLFAAVHAALPPTVPADAPVRSAEVVGRTYARPPVLRLANRLRGLLGDQPGVLGAEVTGGTTRAFRSFVKGRRYDLAWFNSPSAYVHYGSWIDAPAVVDMDDLESQKLLHELQDGHDLRPSAWLRRRLRMIDVVRWRLVELATAEQVARVAVASELDRIRLGVPNAVVVANGYESTFGLDAVPAADCVTFIGSMGYPPNADAARFLCQEIVPALRARRPGTNVRIVGRGGEPALAADDIEIVGFAADLGAELSRAGVLIVPLRSGGGTRIKILEAFALGIPVVSTSVGAEGLEVSAGRHLLLADSAGELAAAVARVLDEPALRSVLVAEARALYDDRYTPDAVRAQVLEAAAGAVTVGATAAG